MIFEVQGKTDDYVRLAKDGTGIKFLGKDFTESNNDELFKKILFNICNYEGFIVQIGGKELVEYEIQLESFASCLTLCLHDSFTFLTKHLIIPSEVHH